MKNTTRLLNRIMTVVTGIAMVCTVSLAAPAAARAAEAWKQTFEDICSKVDLTQNMTIKELETLIEQSDKLQPEIQKSEDPAKKIYLKRLKNCRSMFEFSIDSKKNAGSK